MTGALYRAAFALTGDPQSAARLSQSACEALLPLSDSAEQELQNLNDFEHGHDVVVTLLEGYVAATRGPAGS